MASTGPGRVTAYVLMGDPAYLKQSVAAYYPYVDRIVVSYDSSHTSWTGTPLPIDQCLQIVDEVDVDGKCMRAPGAFARLDQQALANDTHQRQVALDQASEGADWVLQLDTDEVMASPERFFDTLRQADDAGAAGLDYPSRWIYSRVGEGHYLVACDRFLRPVSSYPGPLAVRAGTQLKHARQTDVDLFRVDFRATSTDPWRPRDAQVDAVVNAGEAVLHFSWVRDPEAIKRKFGWSGHHAAMGAPKVYRDWAWRTRHPVLTTVAAPFRRVVDGRYGLARVPEPPGGVPPRVFLNDTDHEVEG